ncbi:MAG: thioredoxin reductase (NADPH) [Candidatus Tokpelaia sp. JSC085]|nr:MAG: thioredoxin reductase (NADPH) [Candidatus Tokpelaia sp. JSC085]
MSHYNIPVLIIGSGPAGYTAAIYAARALLRPTLITGLQQGGQLTMTTAVENYPGFTEPVQGPWLMEQMCQQAACFGAEIIHDVIIHADLSKTPFTLRGDSCTVYTGNALIIATGAQARWLRVPGEEPLRGNGVSSCATCDGFFFRGKDVMVVGGGNTAVEEGLYLSQLAKTVTIVHRRDHFRAEQIVQKRLFSCKNVRVIWNHAVEEIIGTADTSFSQGGGVTGVLLKSVKTGEEKLMNTEGVFVAIGHAPAVSLFEKQLQQKQGGYIWTAADSTATNIPGVFAAGDVTDDVYRQAVTAAGRGCMAALEAERFLKLQGPQRISNRNKL